MTNVTNGRNSGKNVLVPLVPLSVNFTLFGKCFESISWQQYNNNFPEGTVIFFRTLFFRYLFTFVIKIRLSFVYRLAKYIYIF